MVKQLSKHSDQEHVGYYTGLMSAAIGIGLIFGGKYMKKMYLEHKKNEQLTYK